MKPQGVVKQSGHDHLFSGFSKGASNLASFLFGRYKTACGGFSVKRKGESDWLAILSVYNVEAHEWVVCFGNGADFLSAVMNLNASVVKGKFFKDRYGPDGPPDWQVVSYLECLPAEGGLQSPKEEQIKLL